MTVLVVLKLKVSVPLLPRILMAVIGSVESDRVNVAVVPEFEMMIPAGTPASVKVPVVVKLTARLEDAAEVMASPEDIWKVSVSVLVL